MDRLDRIIKRLIKESSDEHSSRYMFFSNLEQIRRQCDLLLDLDHNMIESILENGHDWAQDHIAEAKNNMDQVFDFLMNESKSEGMELSMNIDDKDMVMMEGRKKTGTKLCARGLASAKAKYEELRKTMTAEEAAAALGDAELAKQYEQQSNAEKFAQTMEHVKEIFVSILQ